MSNPISGVVAPNLTPFNSDLSVAEDLYVDHAKWLLTQGLCAITPFGTTGEALSLGIDERVTLLEALVDGGVPASKLLPGTGLTCLPDTVRLCQHAMELGCSGVMVLPPFYYKDVSDEGLYHYYSELIKACPSVRIYLYHIPAVAIIGISLSLIQSLRSAFPEQIVGLKDSSGDWANTKVALTSIPVLATFPGSEISLLDALQIGAPGCITATANVNAAEIVALFNSWQDENADQSQQRLSQFRSVIQADSPISAMKWLLSDATNDEHWRFVRPPLVGLSDEQGSTLRDKLASEFGFDLTAAL